MIRNTVRRILVISVSAALLGILIWISDPARVYQSIREANPLMIFLAMLFTFPLIATKILRWHLLSNHVTQVSLRDASKSYMSGLVLATITPFAAGEAGRALFLPHSAKAKLTGKVLVDKILDLSAVGGLTSIGFIVVNPYGLAWLGHLLWIGIVCGWVLIVVLGRIHGLNEKDGEGVASSVRNVVSGFTDTDIGTLLKSLFLALLGFSFLYAQGFILIRAFAPDTPVGVLWMLPAITLSTIFPIALSGIGVREASAVFLLANYGVASADAFNASFLQFALSTLLPVLLWVVFFRVPELPLQKKADKK